MHALWSSRSYLRARRRGGAGDRICLQGVLRRLDKIFPPCDEGPLHEYQQDVHSDHLPGRMLRRSRLQPPKGLCPNFMVERATRKGDRGGTRGTGCKLGSRLSKEEEGVR